MKNYNFKLFSTWFRVKKNIKFPFLISRKCKCIKEGTFLQTDFLPLEILLIKKSDFEKTKPT